MPAPGWDGVKGLKGNMKPERSPRMVYTVGMYRRMLRESDDKPFRHQALVALASLPAHHLVTLAPDNQTLVTSGTFHGVVDALQSWQSRMEDGEYCLIRYGKQKILYMLHDQRVIQQRLIEEQRLR